MTTQTEATQYIKATLTAFGPDEAISMTQETWAKLHEAMKALAEQPAQQEPDWLTGKQRIYLASAWAMLDDYALDQRIKGNDSFADGAEASAHEIKAMLAAPQPAQQEPVAIGEPVGWHSKQYGFVYMALQPHQFEVGSTLCLKNGTPAWRIESSCSMTALISMSSLPHGTVFYTSPPAQRTWVGLTDEDMAQWIEEEHYVLRWAEDKLKEKNT